MKNFMDKDFLLENEVAKVLYHNYASKVPVFDYHCHLVSMEIATDHKFKNLTEMWLYHDHYKWRAMRSFGIDEEYITGNASDYDKFYQFAKMMPYLIGNPIYHWSHLELKRFFGVEETLSERTADIIWEKCNKAIEENELTAKKLIEMANVVYIGTTDDPIDDLKYHKEVKEDSNFKCSVNPSFRPEKAMKIQNEGFKDYIDKLAEVSNIEIKSFDDLKKALEIRLDYFMEELKMVNLKLKPYNLDEESIKWVEDTIANMTMEEKIGQLFVNMGASREEDYLKSILDSYHIGAVRYNPAKAEEVYEQNRILQENSKIPLLIAANTEMGGNGACTDGTYVGMEVKVAATQDPHYAYELGRISGVEAAAIGCNWSFAPIVDINRNWRNPIISTRTWSADVDQTLELSLEYMRGIMESGILPAAKHFPGDGIDERDQHLSFAPNTLSVEEWNATFGKVYSGLIEAGLPSIMAGHIALPEYVKHFNPEATVQEMNMPATLSKYVLTDLLKGQMGFNGLVVTDASHMVAMTSAMKRKDMLPTAIAAGSDLFLFFNDPDEDFQWMMEGYKNGVITEERLHDALSRILGLKASLGLHKKAKNEILQPKEQAMAKIGLEENKKAALEIADKGITLVKNNEEIFPISPEKTKKVLLVNAKGFDGGFGKFIALMQGPQKGPVDIIKELLDQEGFQVEIYESPIDKIMKLPKEEMGAALGNVYAGKRPISELTSKYDLIINVADVGASVDQRLQWPPSKGTPDIPFYVNEIPTIFVSVQCPFHLADVPQVKTYINTYDSKDYTLKALVDKMMGRSEFKGVSPVDAFCGLGDTRY